jgi:glycosyltransferase involved in cell wall biosynthesis
VDGYQLIEVHGLMKILMPFWNLGEFDRYIPQMKEISERIDEFHITYVVGEVNDEWKKYFEFHKVDLPYSFISSIAFRLWLTKGKIHEQLRDVDVDLYYTLSDFWSQEVARYMALKSTKPYVVRLRGNHKAGREARKIPYYKKKFLNHYETRSLRDANLIIPISSKLSKFAQECGVEEEKVTEVVPIAVDAKHFRPMMVERDDKFTVAYAGRISPEKRVEYLARIAAKLSDIHFMIAGRLQMKVSFASNVEYLGHLQFSEMPTFYNKTDLIVLPSVTEGFGAVILEAYACGKPVLVAKEAFTKEIEVFGSVVDISEFETEIKRLRSIDLKTVGQKARKYVEKYYTWEKFGESIIRHLEILRGEKVASKRDA